MTMLDDSGLDPADHAIDAATLKGYLVTVELLSALIVQAANERLSIDDEPSNYERLILRSKP